MAARRGGRRGAGRANDKRKSLEKAEFEAAVQQFFLAIDEDDNGYLESHEFVMAQAVIAEMAGEEFDHEEVARQFKSIRPWDTNKDKRVSLSEFTVGLTAMTNVLRAQRTDVVSTMTDQVAVCILHTRKELGKVIKEYFAALDQDHDQLLNAKEMEHVKQIAMSLASRAKDQAIIKQGLSFEGFDRSGDGRVDPHEFAIRLADVMLEWKVPKRELVEKLREHAATAGRPATAP
eukprot:gnl/TRDRNA2_/TRDRNA2_128757_c0_seq1.p1 gnl/TRDRNA2_/TRDRNA2_128757_c0~~gnl/TRDRNA2_/TRDRNA2_128757_c0_seq1.p1  ORF type:complete len:233 (+),score=38.27 gnl/TRDRNA2_/TRDRNA2_128757_c0_seq1:45-743(+)